jgi:hypothetical protein
MGGLRSFTRTRPGGETSSNSASRGNIGSRSCGRLRQTISRAKHQKRESDTKDYFRRAAGAGILLPRIFPALSCRIVGSVSPDSVRTGAGALVAIVGAASRSALEIARRTGSFPLARARLAMSQTTTRCLLPTLNCSRVSMTRATRRPLTKVKTRSSISPSIRDEICE